MWNTSAAATSSSWKNSASPSKRSRHLPAQIACCRANSSRQAAWQLLQPAAPNELSPNIIASNCHDLSALQNVRRLYQPAQQHSLSLVFVGESALPSLLQSVFRAPLERPVAAGEIVRRSAPHGLSPLDGLRKTDPPAVPTADDRLPSPGLHSSHSYSATSWPNDNRICKSFCGGCSSLNIRLGWMS